MPRHNFYLFRDRAKDFYNGHFTTLLVIALTAVGLFLLLHSPGELQDQAAPTSEIHFFFLPGCQHCQAQKKFNQALAVKYPNLIITGHDITLPQEQSLLSRFVTERGGLQGHTLGVPVTFIGPHIVIGFDSPETTGATIENALKSYLADNPAIFRFQEQKESGRESIELPWFGTLRPADFSMPALAVILGVVDGFNPCAMWALVYLISLIVSLNDRRKIRLLVGSFVFASGVLYFLFMTAWLNVFILIGYLRPLTILIGLGAIGVGIMNIREYLATKGALTCKIGDPDSRKQTIGRIEKIVRAPLSISSILGVIILAFVINSIEFLCSAALPALFTHTLSLRALTGVQYYGYILVYDFFFMLDDLIIFTLAVLALDTTIGNTYAKHCKMIGAVVLIILGGLMSFAPEMLR